MKINKVLFFMMFIILSSAAVSGFGVISFNSDTKPVTAYAGESAEFKLFLENIGTENEYIFSEVIELADLVVIAGNNKYAVPPGTKDTEVILKIDIPEGAEIGTEYRPRIKFTPISDENEDSMIQLAVGYSVSVPIKVIEKPQEQQQQTVNNTFPTGLVILLLVVLACIIAGYFVYQNKKK